MLHTLKQAGKNIGRELNRAWESLAEGWRELLSSSGNALTHFARDKDRDEAEQGGSIGFPHWALLAGEVEETEKDVLVRLEVPGMKKEDCTITIEGNTLKLSGEKHFERETHDSTYHVMERAYGAFHRSVPLPRNVDSDKAEASYSNGVLTVRLPKLPGEQARSVPIS